MAVPRCKMCGAHLKINSGAESVECEYCGAVHFLNNFKDSDEREQAASVSEVKVESYESKGKNNYETARKAEAQRQEKEREERMAKLIAGEKLRQKKVWTIRCIAAVVVLVVLFFAVIPAARYWNACADLEKGNYFKAYTTFKKLDYFADSRQKAEEAKELYYVYSITEAEIGDIVGIGEYEQDGDLDNGKEIIRWIVLDKKDDKILVLSWQCLDFQVYNKRANVSTTWESCSLRKWLNNDFYNDTFLEKEKAVIVTTLVENNDNMMQGYGYEYHSEGGNDTEDKLFLLSLEEANTYLNTDELLNTSPTEYIKPYAKMMQYDKYCSWWLRTPGLTNEKACYVNGSSFSYISEGGAYTQYEQGVRPAMWIDISKLE